MNSRQTEEGQSLRNICKPTSTGREVNPMVHRHCAAPEPDYSIWSHPQPE